MIDRPHLVQAQRILAAAAGRDADGQAACGAAWHGARLLLGADRIGSFLATVLMRWPRDESVVAGRSRLRQLRSDRSGRAISSRSCPGRWPRAADAAAAARRSTGGISRSSSRRRWSAIVAILAHPLPLAVVTAMLGWWLLLIAIARPRASLAARPADPAVDSARPCRRLGRLRAAAGRAG